MALARAPLELLAEIAREGAITVDSHRDVDGAQVAFARTVVQIDGDVVRAFTRAAMEDSGPEGLRAVAAQHDREVREALGPLFALERGLTWALGVFDRLAAYGGPLTALLGLTTAGGLGLTGYHAGALVSLVVALLGALARTLGRFALRHVDARFLLQLAERIGRKASKGLTTLSS